ncbi:hypothetical protein [Streptococcus salivarius]|uniref:hypothetical protein n=1 Tax=Streptococcus salivarius TaxID=1304 RepID=UPI001EFA15FB|nr:hypothetical protein [Streptococcus salivarius]
MSDISKAPQNTIIGEVGELSSKEILVKTGDGCKLVQVDNILQIHLLEEVADELKRTLRA